MVASRTLFIIIKIPYRTIVHTHIYIYIYYSPTPHEKSNIYNNNSAI